MTRRISVEVPDMFFDVGQFHFKFGLETLGSGDPCLLDPDAQKFRSDFLQEEKDEFDKAYAEGDLLKAIDALCDLVYVALGTAHKMHVSFNQHWDLVHEKNMLKERRQGVILVDERSVRRHVLDVVKPAGWTSPDHAPLVERTRMQYRSLAGTTANDQD